MCHVAPHDMTRVQTSSLRSDNNQMSMNTYIHTCMNMYICIIVCLCVYA